MLEVVILLVIIALVLLFLRAGRQNTIVYRKKVAPPDRGYSVRDHPSTFNPPVSSDYVDNEPGTGHSVHETLAFGGGEFGGGGAGDSYGMASTEPFGGDSEIFGPADDDFNSNESDFNSCDSGTGDSGGNDSCSDSSNDSSSDSSNFSSD